MNRGKVESCSRINDRNGRLTLGDDFEDLYNMDNQEQVSVHMCGFDGVQRRNYIGGEQIRGTEL